MRFSAAALPALLVAIAAPALAGGTGRDGAGACPGSARCVAVRLPAPIVIGNGRLSYRIATAGRVTRVPVPPGPYPRDAIWFPGTATWYRIVRGHLVVGRGRRPLWRSRAKIAPDRLGLVAAGPAAVAFQHDHRLYIARLDGAERPVARRELPLGWSGGELYTYSYPRHELLLRDVGGGLMKTIARRPREYQYDPANQSVYFLSQGALMAAHGTSTWRLASLSRLHMPADVWLAPLADGLVELLDGDRLTVVRPGGSVLAWTSLRRLDRISSFLAIASRGSAVAFTGLTGPPGHPDGESVFVLRRGADAAVAVHDRHGSVGGCAYWASLEWHGSWLLYASSAGALAAIDTAGAQRTIELSRVARRLVGARAGFDAHWAR